MNIQINCPKNCGSQEARPGKRPMVAIGIWNSVVDPSTTHPCIAQQRNGIHDLNLGKAANYGSDFGLGRGSAGSHSGARCRAACMTIYLQRVARTGGVEIRRRCVQHHHHGFASTLQAQSVHQCGLSARVTPINPPFALCIRADWPLLGKCRFANAAALQPSAPCSRCPGDRSHVAKRLARPPVCPITARTRRRRQQVDSAPAETR